MLFILLRTTVKPLQEFWYKLQRYYGMFTNIQDIRTFKWL